jgi:hypothetical protein
MIPKVEKPVFILSQTISFKTIIMIRSRIIFG